MFVGVAFVAASVVLFFVVCAFIVAAVIDTVPHLAAPVVVVIVLVVAHPARVGIRLVVDLRPFLITYFQTLLRALPDSTSAVTVVMRGRDDTFLPAHAFDMCTEVPYDQLYVESVAIPTTSIFSPGTSICQGSLQSFCGDRHLEHKVPVAIAAFLIKAETASTRPRRAKSAPIWSSMISRASNVRPPSSFFLIWKRTVFAGRLLPANTLALFSVDSRISQICGHLTYTYLTLAFDLRATIIFKFLHCSPADSN